MGYASCQSFTLPEQANGQSLHGERTHGRLWETGQKVLSLAQAPGNVQRGDHGMYLLSDTISEKRCYDYPSGYYLGAKVNYATLSCLNTCLN